MNRARTALITVLVLTTVVRAVRADEGGGGLDGTSGAHGSPESKRDGERALHLVGVQVGLLLYLGYDERFSPVATRGPLLGGSLHYEFRGGENHHYLSIHAGFGGAQNGLPDRLGYVDDAGEKKRYAVDRMQILGGLDYAYHRALLTAPGHGTRFYLGGLLDADIGLISSATINWLAAYSLNASTQITAEPHRRHFVALRFYVPFLTYLCRPPWSIYDDAVMDIPEWQNLFRGHVTSVHEYLRLTAQVRYEYSITTTWRLAFSYEISYLHTEDPSPADAVVNSLLVGVTPGFKGRK